MAKKVFAIAGPQTSEVAHFVAHMATATGVPIVSFSATDPTLSESQFPYFIRMAHSDSLVMDCIGELVEMFQWKEVVALHSDDQFGSNGVAALQDSLARSGATVALKASISWRMSDEEISGVLARFADVGARVYVVHTDVAVGRRLFNLAYNLRLMTTGFVWLVTETLCSVLDSIHDDELFVQSTQGVVCLRSYIPESQQLERFKQGWASLLRDHHFRSSSVNRFAIYAYDTIWMLAYAIDRFVTANNGGFEFEGAPTVGESPTDFTRLPVLRSGSTLLRYLMETRFRGATGKVRLSKRGELVGSNLEVVNMVGRGLRVVGYWSSWRKFSVQDPAALSTSSKLRLHHIVWPGGDIRAPRGWMIPRAGKQLVIGVPLKQGYKEFVDARVTPLFFQGTNSSAPSANPITFRGFCIDVFKAALSSLPYSVSYTLVPFGDGVATPSYDELVEKVFNKEFDAAIGDITITRYRAQMVDFTQPYTLSGLVLVVPFTENHAHRAWAFLQPFTTSMWYTMGLFFIFTGFVVWLLEHPKNQDFKGRPAKQFGTSLWFIFSTLFFAQRENVKSTAGRFVVIIWLFVVLILISSYVASLTSILTVRRLKPTIQGLARLVDSNVKIGYQEGSFVKTYLEQLGVDRDRLVALNSVSSYSSALLAERDGVGAVVDELPYMQLLLSSNCKYAITGEDDFSKSGWGFAFQKGSPLAVDVSTAILGLAESGELQRIHETWLHALECSDKLVEVKSDKLDLSAFSGLFGTIAVVALAATLLHLARSAWACYKSSLLAAVPLQRPSGFTRGSRFARCFSVYVQRTGTGSS